MSLQKMWLVVILGLASVAAADSKVKVLRLAHGLNTQHPVHKAMVYMADKVDKKSAGRMKVEVYPSEQLGNEKECIDALQLGYLGITKISSAVLEAFVEEYKVFGIPYLFRDSEHFWQVANGPIGKEILASGESKRLKGLCYYDAGARSFYSKKPISSPGDLNAGGVTMKIRVMNSPMAFEMISTMGGSPTPISWGELYTSLDQGVVDAAENNPPSLYTSRHYEICKYYCLDEHVRVPDVLVISTRVWADLSVEQQRILLEAVAESVEYQRKIWIESEQESFNVFKEKGIEIIYPEKAPFIESVQPIWQKYRKTSLRPFIDRIVEVKSDQAG
ncbi:MAG: TRAP transporter substrate-binding protein [Planctomycetota bacterium]|jgi:tripartite ATP-independent transporter DctP family solute receptor